MHSASNFSKNFAQACTRRAHCDTHITFARPRKARVHSLDLQAARSGNPRLGSQLKAWCLSLDVDCPQTVQHLLGPDLHLRRRPVEDRKVFVVL